jgi:2-oxoglutarate dehydrogenase E2 component (dihydrolipoamide succinyltransferase)
MPVSVTMPRLGESVSEGTVTRWLKQEGERVEADEPLLEVSTDKVDTEIPAPSSGVLTSIKVGEDETVDVGVELAIISEGEAGAAEGGADDGAAPTQDSAAPPAEEAPQQPAAAETPAAAAEPQAAEEAPAPAAAAATTPPPAEPAGPADTDGKAAPADSGGDEGGGNGPYVTPLVRRLAAEHDVDLSAVRGTGVGGRIRKQDVLDAARSGAPAGNGAGADSAAGRPTPTIEQPAATRPSAPQAPAKASQRGLRHSPRCADTPKSFLGCGRSSRLGWWRAFRSARN